MNSMPNRAPDWLKQAERDLAHARRAHENAEFEWACFAAHQAAEMAVKAAFAALEGKAWGHVVAGLLAELAQRIEVPAHLSEIAKVLDNYYIPTRYPDSHPEGAPADHYGLVQSQGAIEHASDILTFARGVVAQGR